MYESRVMDRIKTSSDKRRKLFRQPNIYQVCIRFRAMLTEHFILSCNNSKRARLCASFRLTYTFNRVKKQKPENYRNNLLAAALCHSRSVRLCPFSVRENQKCDWNTTVQSSPFWALIGKFRLLLVVDPLRSGSCRVLLRPITRGIGKVPFVI